MDALQSAPLRSRRSPSNGVSTEGPALAHSRDADIISDATPLGVAGAGVGPADSLMADRQTAGGYPKIATTISADISLAGSSTRRSDPFTVCSPREAMAALIAQERALMPSGGGRNTSAGGGEWKMLRVAFGNRVQQDAPLAPLTTFRVGGPADWLIETRSSDEIVATLTLAHRAGVPVTVLGGGSNVLVSDSGVRGLVVRPRAGEVRQIDEGRVRADAAVSINGLVRWTINHGRAGLEAWAGTPGTVGGGIFGNAHFGGRLIGDLVTEVRLAATDGTMADVPGAAMAFGYDRSRLQRTGEVLLSAVFVVSPGDPAALRATARESLAYRKRTQPLDTPHAGCCFRNPSAGATPPDGMPWSAGALVDSAGLKGTAIGGARVAPVHGKFIVNEGGATADDIRRLIDRCRVAVRERFGVELREEIVYLGKFDSEQTTDD